MGTLLELFKRYTPPIEYVEILQSAVNIATRVERERKMLEVDAAIPFLVEKEVLYRIEAQVCEAHQINSVRINPKYDKELFDKNYIPQILMETQRTGIIAQGFFNDCSINIDDENKKITIDVAMSNGGVDLLYDGKTQILIEKIIKSEFDLDFEIEIRQKDNYEYNYSAYEKQQKEMLSAMTREIEKQISAEPEDEIPKEGPELKMIESLFENEVENQAVTDYIYKIGNMVFNTENCAYIFGGDFEIVPVPIRNATQPKRSVIVLGEVFKFEHKINRSGDRTVISFDMTDEDMSITVKQIIENERADAIIKNVKAGKAVAVKGITKDDKYENELVIEATNIAIIDKIDRIDYAEVKRTELHLHTNMSSMDAVVTPEKLLRLAARWGHKAIAVTDHGNVQTFPEIMEVKEKMKSTIKVIYGMEAYFVDDTAKAVYGTANAAFTDEFVVFDIETTGLSALQDKITEIGAVIVKSGKVLKTFHTYVNPERPIPIEITQLTGITDEMVEDAPTTEEAVKTFLKFAGNRILIAHNAGFDISFIRKAADDFKLYFNNSYLDTVALSRYINPDLKRHKLDAVAEYFGLGGFTHHRATDDAEVLAKIFYKMVDKFKQEGIKDIVNMVKSMSDKADPLKLPTFHMIILVKNLTGLKNLYKLISMSYLNYFYKCPRIPKTILNEYRDGLIVGTACESGELFSALKDNKSHAELVSIAEYYDYLEIQPICNNRFLINEGKASGEEDLRDFNRKIIALGEEVGKPVVATCDVHFINKHDEIYRKILLSGMKYPDADRDIGLYLRTTDEMLEEFEYLGKDKAYEVVVTNSNLIGEMIENIRPIPLGTFKPEIAGSDTDLQEIVWNKAREIYGDPLPEIVTARIDKEMSSIIKNGFAVMYIIARKLVKFSEDEGYSVGSRGSVGSSIVATFADISEVNPLPPHYVCPNCKFSDFDVPKQYGSGFDLPQRNCPECGNPLNQDGHDIPFESFLGFYGEKSPDIDLNFSGNIQSKVHEYTEQLFGSQNVFRAGTLGTLADKTTYGFVARYLEGKGVTIRKAEMNRLINNCVGVKRTTGQHPGGIIVVPNDKDIYDFTPIQHPADDAGSGVITTHFAFSYLHDTVLKLDELGHDVPTKYKKMEEYTGIKIAEVPMNDPNVYELFKSPKPLKVAVADIDSQLGTFGLPEMSTRFVQQVLLEAKPQNFSDLLQVAGLTHGTDVWLGNAQELIKNGTCTISEVVGTRDSIMLYLIGKGLDSSIAFKITEDVRKGKGLTAEFETAMRENDVPNWYITSCKKIKYMYPKAHATAYVMSAIKLGWYKIYKPLEFYAAFFTVAPGGFDAEIVMRGKSFVMNTFKTIEKKGNEATQKENELVSTLQLVNEFYARGLKFLPVNLYQSDSHAFLIENGKVRLPFTSLPGLGDNAAVRLKETCKNGDILSVEELRQRAQLSKTIVEILSRNKVLDNLSQTNQINFFNI